jgi:glycerophosphoryl diester phosphodiesterase
MKDLNWLKTNNIAHRGLHSKDKKVPENSLLAFEKAMEKGYSIELDLNVLKDGTVVSFHDVNLKRLCNDPRILSDLNKEDIQDLKLLNTNEHIATLEDVLKLVNQKVPLLIELKPHGNVIFLCESFMQVMKDYQGVYAIFSFHPKVVQWFKNNYPEVIRGQIAEFFKNNNQMSKLSKYLMKSMFFNRFTKPDFVSYGIYDMPNKYLDRLMKKGMTVISYAAKTQEELDFVRSRYHNSVFEYFEPKN